MHQHTDKMYVEYIPHQIQSTGERSSLNQAAKVNKTYTYYSVSQSNLLPADSQDMELTSNQFYKACVCISQ